MVTTRQFLNKLNTRINNRRIIKTKALQCLAGKKLNLKWRLKRVSDEINLVDRMQRKVLRKRF